MILRAQLIKPFNILTLFFLLLLACVITFLGLIAPSLFAHYLGIVFNKNNMSSIIYLVVYTFLFFFIVPCFAGKYIYKEPIKDLGLVFPENKMKTIFHIVFSLSLLIPWIFYFGHCKEFQGYSQSGLGFFGFIFLQLFLLPIYYFAEEFFFRGFLFISLWKRVGYHSFWITDIFFTYAHLGKPLLEIVMAIPASIILNYLTLKTKSIYPAVFVHAALGFLLNILMTFDVMGYLS